MAFRRRRPGVAGGGRVLDQREHLIVGEPDELAVSLSLPNAISPPLAAVTVAWL
jgi:hypothetical protein